MRHQPKLIETILWENNGFFLQDMHLERLKQSALYFSFPYDTGPITQKLNTFVSSYEKNKKYKVRLTLEKSGNMQVSSQILNTDLSEPVKAVFSTYKTDSKDVFLYHKTTNRAIYDQELKKYRGKGFFEVIFSNQEGQITEGAISNIFIKKGSELLTPPVSCGLLNGTFRQYLLSGVETPHWGVSTGFMPDFVETPQWGVSTPIKEKIFYEEDIIGADKVFMVNSVRKVVCVVVDSSAPAGASE